MILLLQDASEKIPKVTNELKKTEEALNDSTVFQDIINLLDVIIWPIALIIALYMFKEHIGRIIKSLGSIKAGASGFELNFIEDKLEEATKLIGMGSPEVIAKDGGGIIPKDGGGIIPKDGGGIIPKDGGGIIPKDGSDITPKSGNTVVPQQSQANSPYQELIELQDAISVKLKSLASQNGMNSIHSSNFALTNDLANRNIINSYTAQKLKMLIELNTMGLNSPKTSHDQVSQMKRLFNNINF